MGAFFFILVFSMIVLGIETTCDETAASLVKDGREILSNVVATLCRYP